MKITIFENIPVEVFLYGKKPANDLQCSMFFHIIFQRFIFY